MPLFNQQRGIGGTTPKTLWTAIILAGAVTTGAGFVALQAANKSAATIAASAIAKGDVQTVTISSQSELLSALTSLEDGSTIQLMAGYYPVVEIKGITTHGTITISSADPNKPAVIGQVNVRASTGIKFKDLHFKARLIDGWFPFFVFNSDNIIFDNIKVEGKRASGIAVKEAAAMMIRASRHIEVKGSDFSQSRHGLELLEVEGIKITDNVFHDLQTDGVRGGGVSDALISGNIFTDYKPAERDHPDGIQLWSTNQKRPGRNIVIRDNLVVRGVGDPTQGIFIRDTRNQMPFENIEISGNMVIGGLYNGIAINGVIGAQITDNEVIAYPRSKSWIRIDNGRDVALENNRAMFYMLRGENKNIKQSKNKTTYPTNRGLNEKLKAWTDQKTAFPASRSSVYKTIMARLESSPQ